MINQETKELIIETARIEEVVSDFVTLIYEYNRTRPFKSNARDV